MIVPIVLFLVVFGIVYVFLTHRHREKMYMMENNLNPDEYSMRLFRNTHEALKHGMLLIGISIGISGGYILENGLGMGNEFAYPISITFFAGLSLIIFFFVEKNSLKGD